MNQTSDVILVLSFVSTFSFIVTDWVESDASVGSVDLESGTPTKSLELVSESSTRDLAVDSWTCISSLEMESWTSTSSCDSRSGTCVVSVPSGSGLSSIWFWSWISVNSARGALGSLSCGDRDDDDVVLGGLFLSSCWRMN